MDFVQTNSAFLSKRTFKKSYQPQTLEQQCTVTLANDLSQYII